MLQKSKPEDAKLLWAEAQQDAEQRFHLYEYLAQRKLDKATVPAEPHKDAPVPAETTK